MKHSQPNTHRMTLLNSRGETVRSFALAAGSGQSSEKISVVYRRDLNRIEPRYETQTLDTASIEYSIVGETSVKELKVRPLEIGRVGSLTWVEDEKAKLPPTFELKADEDHKDLVLVGRWVGGAQAILLGVLLLLGHFLTSQPPEESVTTIRAVELEKITKTEMPVVTRTVKEPVKTARVKPNVKREVRRPEPRIITRQAPKVQKRQATAQMPSQSLENMGALGALGGLSKKKQSGGGLNLSGASLARGGDSGQGGGGVGSGGTGGVSGALFGKGLIAASNGSGARAGSAGGYGTKGKGGGRQGYGTHNMAGASSGYVAPLDSESFVGGGLTREQVEEVILRNMGQITYCYEKGLQTEPSLKGRVSVNFVIGATGRVSTANVQHSSVDSSDLENCIVGRLKGFKFPQPVAGVNVQVQYPFSFRRVSAN